MRGADEHAHLDPVVFSRRRAAIDAPHLFLFLQDQTAQPAAVRPLPLILGTHTEIIIIQQPFIIEKTMHVRQIRPADVPQKRFLLLVGRNLIGKNPLAKPFPHDAPFPFQDIIVPCLVQINAAFGAF